MHGQSMSRLVICCCLLRMLSSAAGFAATVTVRSGNGTIGGRDASITFLQGPADTDFASPFTQTDFTNAQNGPAAFILSPWAGWVPSLSADPSAKWIGSSSISSSSQGNTALYAISFTIPNAFSSATLTLNFAVDDNLGKFGEGLYLNGNPLSLLWSANCNAVVGTANQYGQEDSATCTGIGSLLQIGTNWLYFDDENLAAEAGIIFSATFTTTDVLTSPQPSILSLTPAAAPVGSGSLPVTINGNGFFSSSTVLVNGVAHPAALISGSQLSVTLTPADLATLGSFPIVVVNPSPGGATQPITFVVQPSVSTQVTVPGTAMPWRYSVVAGGLNYDYQYGLDDGTSPAVASSANGLAFSPGEVITVTYLSGTVSQGPESNSPYTDANGNLSIESNNNPGSTGKVTPGYYMAPSTFPIYAGELVGTFADSNGDIVGTPFPIGDGPTDLVIPPIAAQLQLGMNDDKYSDNEGAWVLNVTGPAPGTPSLISPANGSFVSASQVELLWNAGSNSTSQDLYLGTSTPPPLFQASVSGSSYSPSGLQSGITYYWQIVSKSSSGSIPSAIWSFSTEGLRFLAVAPCRVMDTRGATGLFGGPSIAGGAIRNVPIPQSGCNIPANAQAYSLNITVVPPGPLTYLTAWPTGQTQPVVSTLNSYDGRVVANAAIVAAGASGAISIYVSNTTDVIIDINGYFAPAATAGSTPFYAATPCRVVDTRNGTGPLAGPYLSGGSTRSFAVPSSVCGIPSTALAYSLNITVVPHGPLSWLTAWPTGQPEPLVSTLNSYDGSTVANAAIVPAGTGGAISVYVTDDTDLVIDINGYFAPSGSAGALSLYTLTPCRVADTRQATGPFGGPTLAAGGTRSFAIPSSACGVPSTAQAYSFNVTAVPPGPLVYLTAWATGLGQPVVSTLNSLEGKVVANAAIVPAGTGGAVNIFVSNATDVILDINAYFAQ